MATARPAPPASEATRTAEHAFYRVVDGVCTDLCILREHWPSRTVPDVVAAEARLAAREAPGGEAERALSALHRAYGGAARLPDPVRRRLEAYVEERLGRPPWPERDLSEDLNRPAIVRKAARRRREARHPEVG